MSSRYSGTSLCGSAGWRAVVLRQAKFTMDGGKIANAVPACNIDIGVAMNDSGQATLKNGVSMENLQTALQMSGNSRATLTGTIMKRAVPSNCGGDPMINLFIGAPTLTLQNSQIINSGEASPIGIRIDNTTAASLTLIGTTLRDFKGGTG